MGSAGDAATPLLSAEGGPPTTTEARQAHPIPRSAYLAMLALGYGLLLPWNVVLNSIPYVSDKYAQNNSGFYLSVAFSYHTLLSYPALAVWGKRVGFSWRIIPCFLIQGIILSLIPAVDDFVTTVALVGVIGLVGAVLGSSLYGLASLLSPSLSQAMLTGHGISGVLSSLMQLGLRAVLHSQMAEVVFCTISLFVMLGCACAYVHLMRLPYTRDCVTPLPEGPTGPKRRARGEEARAGGAEAGATASGGKVLPSSGSGSSSARETTAPLAATSAASSARRLSVDTARSRSRRGSAATLPDEETGLALSPRPGAGAAGFVAASSSSSSNSNSASSSDGGAGAVSSRSEEARPLLAEQDGAEAVAVGAGPATSADLAKAQGGCCARQRAPGGVLYVLRRIWIEALTLGLVFIATFLLFPSVSPGLTPYHGGVALDLSPGTWQLVLILTFNVADTVGRMLPFSFLRGWGLLTFTIARFGVAPMLLGAAYSWSPALQNDITVFFMISFLACTNGHLTTLCMKQGPARVDAAYRERAGSILSLCLNAGIFVGSQLALLFSGEGF